MLPIAVGIAVSPLPIVAVVLMLATPRGRADGPAFVPRGSSAAAIGVIVIAAVGTTPSGLRGDADWRERPQAGPGRAAPADRRQAVAGPPARRRAEELPRWMARSTSSGRSRPWAPASRCRSSTRSRGEADRGRDLGLLLLGAPTPCGAPDHPLRAIRGAEPGSSLWRLVNRTDKGWHLNEHRVGQPGPGHQLRRVPVVAADHLLHDRVLRDPLPGRLRPVPGSRAERLGEGRLAALHHRAALPGPASCT